jgi:hypothetical protein
LSAALGGISVEPPPHAEQIASAIEAPAYLNKAVAFMTVLPSAEARFYISARMQ